MKRVIVVGGGWAGLTASWFLSRSGYDVTLLEASPQLGGRARTFTGPENMQLDNGQHLLSGAYTQTLALIDTWCDRGSVLKSVGEHIPFEDASVRWVLKHNHRMPPKHVQPWLFQIPGIFFLKRLQAASFLFKWLKQIQDKSDSFWLNDLSIQAYLIKHKAHLKLDPLYFKRWLEPLCWATMNASLEESSMYRFTQVLSQTLLGSKSTAQWLLPRVSLDELFVEPISKAILQAGGRIEKRKRVDRVVFQDPVLMRGNVAGVETNGEFLAADSVILATPPRATAQLIKNMLDFKEKALALEKLPHHAIRTTYWELTGDAREQARLPGMMGLIQAPCQWVFQRSDLLPGCVAAVTSGVDLNDPVLQNHSHLESCLKKCFPSLRPRFIKTLTEKQATFKPSPGSHQALLWMDSPYFNLHFAGDHVYPHFPATLESAVRSGLKAAGAVQSSLQRVQRNHVLSSS